MENNNKNSRRKFLDKGLKLGLVTAIGGIGISKIVNKLNAKIDNSSSETIELMTTDGTLIQVPISEVNEIPSLKDDNYNVREGYPNKKFVMVGDLSKCKNV